LSLPHPVSAPIVRVGSVAAWLAAVRPRTLPVAISPVLVGAALGWQRTGALDLQVAAIALAASLLMQVVSNLQNDVGYTVRGAERSGTRTGLPRATALGWLQVHWVRWAIVACSAGRCWRSGSARSRRRWPTWAARGRSPTPRSASGPCSSSSGWWRWSAPTGC
jgi:1,4-dihydroxy-2-naphthoate octaprenyltransferase